MKQFQPHLHILEEMTEVIMNQNEYLNTLPSQRGQRAKKIIKKKNILVHKTLNRFKCAKG